MMEVVSLQMRFAHLPSAALPDAVLPDGYMLFSASEAGEDGRRRITDSEIEQWISVVSQSFGDFVVDWNTMRAEQELFRTPHVDQEGFLLIAHKDSPRIAVATAHAYHSSEDGEQGRVHWVAVVPEHQRRGLARALVLMTMRHHQKQGRTSLFLTTESFRTPAISLYLQLGFVPEARSKGEEAEWERLLSDMRMLPG